MKLKIFLLTIIISCMFPLNMKALTGNIMINGYWGNWKPLYSIYFNGYINDFVLYSFDGHPSDFFVRVRINNYSAPSKDQMKQHRKTNTWFEYTGTVEYYVTDKYPTIEAVFKAYNDPWGTWYMMRPSLLTAERYVKRTAQATIKTSPQKVPTFNIYFDGVGFAISFGE